MTKNISTIFPSDLNRITGLSECLKYQVEARVFFLSLLFVYNLEWRGGLFLQVNQENFR